MDYAELQGKHVLVGLTFEDQDGHLIEQFQTHGIVIAASKRGGIVLEKRDGTGIFTLPPNLDTFIPARPGEYRLRSTGEVVVDPDLLTSWTVTSPSSEYVALRKQSGMEGPFD